MKKAAFLLLLLVFPVSLSCATSASSSPERVFLPQDVAEYQKQRQAEAPAEKAERGKKLRLTGDVFMYGKDTKQDYAEAFYWYRAAAELGDTDSKNQIGLIFDEGGHGITRDPEKATKWFLLAAEEGNGAAQVNMALRYDSRSGGERPDSAIKPDGAMAVKWYRKAAEQGVGIAQRNLGACYESGRGVQKNPEEAYFWYGLMHKGGVAENNFGTISNAKIYMENVALSLTKKQVENVQNRIQAWKPVSPPSP